MDWLETKIVYLKNRKIKQKFYTFYNILINSKKGPNNWKMKKWNFKICIKESKTEHWLSKWSANKFWRQKKLLFSVKQAKKQIYLVKVA